MGCNCSLVERVIAVVILVFAIWNTSASRWIIGIAAVVLLAHSFKCPNCKVTATKKKGK